MSSANALNLGKPKILSSGKGLSNASINCLELFYGIKRLLTQECMTRQNREWLINFIRDRLSF